MPTDLHAAVESGCLEEKDSNSGETPLHAAARLGNADIVRALLEAGADISRLLQVSENRKFFGQLHADVNALHIAAAFGHTSALEVLLAAAENQPIEPDTSYHSLYLAAVYGHLDILEFLLARLPFEIQEKNGTLCYALYYGQVECARSLISSGAKTNQSLAIDEYSGLERDAMINYPLYFALASPEPLPIFFPAVAFKTDEVVLELVQMLVEDGADIDAKCCISLDYGRFNECTEANILSCAACNGRFEATKYLLAKGADTGMNCEYGWGILHSAVASGSPETVGVLLKAGASDQVPWKIFMPETNSKKGTALDIIGICDDRLHHLRNNNTLVSDYVDIINVLVENGADVEAKDEFSNTLLHSACLNGDYRTAAVCYLNDDWELGIYSDEYNIHYMQPLCRTLPLVSAYLKAGANPNALNNRMQTPLHCLLMDVMIVIDGFPSTDSGWPSWSEERTRPPIKEFLKTLCSTIQVLVAGGANLNLKNVKGYKPLHELVRGLDKHYQSHNKKILEDAQHERYPQSYLINNYTFSPPISQREIHNVIVQLLQGGARDWEVVPEPCFGAEKALFHVWKSGDNMDLRYLFEKLEDRLKPRLRMILRVLNRLLAGKTELHLQILSAAL